MTQEQSAWSPSQLAAQRTAKRRSTYYSRLSLAPFLGVIIALTFLFILPRAIIIDLPIGRGVADLAVVAHPTPEPGALREDSVRVLLSRNGNVYCNGRQVSIAELPEAIQSSMLPSTEKKIYVEADARAKYRDVKAVAEKIRLTGITQICFLVEKGDPAKFHR
jgi:biopolymer transport protein ExbD